MFFGAKFFSVTLLPQTIAKLSCGYFFICAGLGYGSVMSRIPALTVQTNVDEIQLGIVLFTIGMGGIVGLLLSGYLTARFGSFRIAATGGLIFLVCLPLIGLSYDAPTLYLTSLLFGFTLGLAEVPMNTQGLCIERHWNRSCMSFMHAMFSLGGLLGSIVGAIFAALQWPPAYQLIVISLFLLLFFPVSKKNLYHDYPQQQQTKKTWHTPPALIFIYGYLVMCVYSAGGSVAEWGGVLLYQAKGASEAIAALPYAAYATCIVVCRLFGDRMREYFTDGLLMKICSLFATLGIIVVLSSTSPIICLVGYAAMGLGFSLTTPILFSQAGANVPISIGTTSAILSICGYGGELLVPPLIGFIAKGTDLATALLIVVGLCLCLLFASFFFCRLLFGRKSGGITKT